MIEYIQGNIFTSNAKVLVNTVNTVGVMGKGVALEFKKYYPNMFDEYKKLCDEKKFDIGDLHLYKTSNKWILNFPTKKHWRNPSKIEYIEQGLQRLVQDAAKMQITDIAMPKLGCGNGGLDWELQVKPLVEKYLKKFPMNVAIYEFDKTLTPEHLTQKDIEKWLLSDPKNLSFHLFLEDLISCYTPKTLIENKYLLHNKSYNISYDDKDELFIISNQEEKIILAKEDIRMLFSALKSLGRLSHYDIPHELYHYKQEIFDFFAHLNYIVRNHDKIVLNYTESIEELELEVLDAI